MKLKAIHEIAKWLDVSIPKRVSEALKLTKSDIALSSRCVSIPKRVSEALKLSSTAKNI